MLILDNSGMLLTSRENLFLGKLFIFEKIPTFWKLMEQIKKTLNTKSSFKMGLFRSKILSEISPSFGHFSTVLAITPSF